MWPWAWRSLNSDSDDSDLESKISRNKTKKRLIGVLDVDSFEVQIWLQKFPDFEGRPCVVTDQSGRILSVSQEAKDLGVRRDQHRASQLPPNIHIFVKPNNYDKPDAQETRETTWKLTDTIQNFLREENNIIMQVVPSDQWYFDITEAQLPDFDQEKNIILESEFQTFKDSDFYWAFDDDVRLLKGAKFLAQVAEHLNITTGFSCSGGVSTNLLLAKIACDFNKPGNITALNPKALNRIALDIRIETVPGLKQKTGEKVKDILKIEKLAQLKRIYLEVLQLHFSESDSKMIFNTARGICDIPVVSKTATVAVSCGKTNLSINSNSELRSELDMRCSEFIDRLDLEWNKFDRTPRTWKLEIKYFENFGCGKLCSQGCSLMQTETVSQLAQQCLENVIGSKIDFKNHTITTVKLSASNFITRCRQAHEIELTQAIERVIERLKNIRHDDSESRVSSIF